MNGIRRKKEKKERKKLSGHEIAPNTVANATKIIVLATKIQKLVAKWRPEFFEFSISYLDVFDN